MFELLYLFEYTAIREVAQAAYKIGSCLEQAIVAYTRGSAFAEFEENEKGTIVNGKLSDIAVLSDDIFTMPVDALPQTESILTRVGGEVVYDAKVLN